MSDPGFHWDQQGENGNLNPSFPQPIVPSDNTAAATPNAEAAEPSAQQVGAVAPSRRLAAVHEQQARDQQSATPPAPTTTQREGSSPGVHPQPPRPMDQPPANPWTTQSGSPNPASTDEHGPAPYERPQGSTVPQYAAAPLPTHETPSVSVQQTYVPPTGPPQATQGPPAQAQPSQNATSGSSSGVDALLGSIEESRATRRTPGSGFLRRLGLSSKRQELADRRRIAEEVLKLPIERSIHGKRVVYLPVWSQKGGVGKTTSAVGVAETMAEVTPMPTALIDTNPDGGSAAVKLGRSTRKTVLDLRDVLISEEAARKLTPAALHEYFNTHRTRLESLLLAPGKKASKDEELTAMDLWKITQCVEQLMPYKIVFIDCGTNPSSDVMSAIRYLADQMIIITTTSPDEASVAVGGLDALRAAGHGALVKRAITLVVDTTDPKSLEHVEVGTRDDLTRSARRSFEKELQRKHAEDAKNIRAYFEAHTGQVLSVPYDPMISIEATLDRRNLSEETRVAYLEASAAVVRNLHAASQLWLSKNQS